MPVTQKVVGSGITKRKQYGVHIGVDGKFNNEDIRLIRADMEKVGLSHVLEPQEAYAKAILARAKLPTETWRLREVKSGKWKAITSLTLPRKLPVSYCWMIAGVTDALGFAPDSREGYAARIVDRIYWIRRYLKEGNAESACEKSIALGVLVSEARLKYATKADGPSRGGIKAAANRFNNYDSAAITKSFEKALKSGNIGQAETKVAAQFKITTRTVRRHVNKSGH